LLRIVLALLSLAALASCAPVSGPQLGPDGQPAQRVYRISAREEPQIQARMLDGVNALRQAAGVQSLQLSAALNVAAAQHSRDISQQNRPWNYGSDGSSPLDRAARAGYTAQVKGEAVSETYETELETLAAWMEAPETRPILLDPGARDLGFSFFQEPNGKIWWTLITGG
jgi:uncharacterized protein YkwD